MTGKRVAVFTVNYKDGRVETYRLASIGRNIVRLSRPVDDVVIKEWEAADRVERICAWHAINEIDRYVKTIECSDAEPCHGRDCDACSRRLEEADVLV